MGRDTATFDDFINEMEAEIRAEGPAAVEQAQALKLNLRIASQVLGRRLDLKLTQAELAERVGIGQSEISKLERGAGSPTYRTLAKVADALDADIKIVPRKRVARAQRVPAQKRPVVRRAARVAEYAHAVSHKRRSR